MGSAQSWAEDLTWSEENLRNLRDVANIANANLILLGPAGAGKSSFFNTVSTAASGVLKSGASTRGNAQSVTQTIRRYQVEFGNVDVCDTIGMSSTEGIDYEVERLLLSGKMPTTDDSPVVTNGNDNIDAAVIVVDAKAISTQVTQIKRSVTKVQEAFELLDIPYIMVLTKVDEVDNGLSQNLRNIFYNDEIHQRVKIAEDAFGVSMNKIWPIMNYDKDRSNRNDIDILALSAMKMVLQFAADKRVRKMVVPNNSINSNNNSDTTPG